MINDREKVIAVVNDYIEDPELNVVDKLQNIKLIFVGEHDFCRFLEHFLNSRIS